jgi:hypothetical protein
MGSFWPAESASEWADEPVSANTTNQSEMNQEKSSEVALAPVTKVPKRLVSRFRSAEPALFQKEHCRAPISETRLKKVKADESGEPIPFGIYGHSQGDRHKNEETCHQSQSAFNRHCESPFFIIHLPGAVSV